jgi:hypothetical protein
MATLAHQIMKMGKLSYVFILEHYKTNQEESDIGPLRKYKGLRIMALRAEFDTYDDLTFPTQGYNLYNSVDFGLDIIGQHDTFFEYTMTAKGAFSPFKGHTFLPAMYVNMADVSLPDPVRNYLGGATELSMNDDIVFFNSFPLYGYSEQAFTGDYLMAFRLAYRISFPSNFYLFFIGNAGKTWMRSEFKWSRLLSALAEDSYKGIAVTFAVDIPKIGPASLTGAMPVLSESGYIEDFSNFFYLSIGHNF